MWRLAKHSIPTLDVLSHRNMSDTPYCPLCGMCDSWEHALVDCSLARSVWALAKEELVEHMIMTTIPDAKLRLATMHDSLQRD